MSIQHHIRKFKGADPGLVGPEEALELMDIYFADVRRDARILLWGEEKLFSKQVMRGHRASLRLSQDHLEPHQRKGLEIKVEEGRSARNSLVVNNLRLVICIANCYRGIGLPFLDVIQEGNTGLIEAAEDYDHTKGARFATFAAWDIRGAITRALADQRRTIRCAEWFTDGLRFFGNVQGALYQEMKREPTIDELTDATGWTRDSVILALSIGPTIDIDGYIKGSGGKRPLSDIVADQNALSPEDALIANGDRLEDKIYRMLDEIPPKYSSIILRYYGLGNHEQQDLTELGIRLGVTRAATSRRHRLGIEALRELAEKTLF